jgi:N-acetylglucosamine malate deacetylase 1
MAKNAKIMAIGAHPDDIEIYMSGTMAKYQKKGYHIYYIIATDGSKGGKEKAEDIRKRRKTEAESSAKCLDVKPIFLDYHDGELTYDASSYQKMRELLDDVRPHLIFTHNPEDYHADHRVLSKLVFDAASFKVPVVYCDSLLGANFHPNFYIDITKEFKLKREMISKHKSQLHIGILKIAELLNQFRGAQATGKLSQYAEAYAVATVQKSIEISRMLPFD